MLENEENTCEPKDGEMVGLFLDKFNPPSSDHYAAIETLLTKPEINKVWIAPYFSSGKTNEHIRAMCFILSFALIPFAGRKVGICSIGLDKKLNEKEVVDWCRNRYKSILFSPIQFHSELELNHSPPPVDTYSLVFPHQTQILKIAHESRVVLVNKLPIKNGLIERIQNGLDESRNFPPGIWKYIQKNQLYR